MLVLGGVVGVAHFITGHEQVGWLVVLGLTAL